MIDLTSNVYWGWQICIPNLIDLKKTMMKDLLKLFSKIYETMLIAKEYFEYYLFDLWVVDDVSIQRTLNQQSFVPHLKCNLTEFN